VFILRQTRFGDSQGTGCVVAPARGEAGKNLLRLSGRNVPLDQVVATAHQCPVSRVVLPKDASTNRFDFLVTVRNKPVERLQAAVKRKLGYSARWQEHETEVYQLRVRTFNARGLRPATTGRSTVNFIEGRLCFTNQPLANLCGALENALKKPVQDKTGLNGNYDFSILWNWRGAKAMDEKSVLSATSELGLMLTKDNELMQMLVVEPAKD
jgi:uncharacterized protein (TIGR03435 family)